MKRLISLVLVAALSFFSFMVYAEDEVPVTDYYLSDVALASFPSDNLGFLPSPLLGTLNLSAGEGIGTLGYAMLNPGSSRINFQPVGSDSPSTPARFVSSGLSSGSSLDSLLFFWAGSRTLTLIPRWATSFDSFAAPELPAKRYAQDTRDFEPVPYRVVFHTLLANFAHVIGADKLARWAWATRERAEEVEEVAPEEIDFEEFFSHRPEDEG